MCLSVESLKPKTSKEDVVCYKVLIEPVKGHYYTPFQLQEVDVVPNSIQLSSDYDIVITRRNFIVMPTPFYEIEKGFVHTFKSLDDAKETCKLDIQPEMDIINGKCHIFECVIPGGIEYYEGECGLESITYASSSIVFKKCVYSDGEFKEGDTDYDRAFKLQLHRMGLLHFDVKLLKKIFDYLVPRVSDNDNAAGTILMQIMRNEINNHPSVTIIATLGTAFKYLTDYCEEDKFLLSCIFSSLMNKAVFDDSIDLEKIFNIVTTTDILKNINWECKITGGVHGSYAYDYEMLTKMFPKPYNYFDFLTIYRHKDINYIEQMIIRDMVDHLIVKSMETNDNK